MNKYRNIKTSVGGIVFDSKKESARYCELMLLQKAGRIKDLQRQVRFLICPKNGDERAAYYEADFVYTDCSGKKIIEDVKSKITRKNPLYVLKRKLVKNIYRDFEFLES